ncbi:DMT family transporter [Gallaecimonas pentaromativorans]|uniref:EamA-like transporter family protein n=1 Tax=Gallaecimonas pentaromativorans TaxID=584787 RepID=A0A3N1P8J9_9GAMM|nr:DMT family transporter [Gallaecimonas pentaromativorans]ROQ24873.1 EamA-like transporter family protein [Gallaecimonas pentaromativorans]
MSPWRLWLAVTLTMVAFAANSLLCRIALTQSSIDAASFTLLRLVSGALMLSLLVLMRRRPLAGHGSWQSALALFGYAAAFSFAYLALATGSGALLLFGAVQATMIGVGLYRGERLGTGQWLGLMLALGGVVVLLLPGITAPPLASALLMLLAGACWGCYSLWGRAATDPLAASAGNFLKALLPALLLALWLMPSLRVDALGVVCAIASGALASGLGYALWYRVLPALKATVAATVQLSVPLLAALGGLLLGEGLSWRLVLAACAILGGIGLVIRARASA